MTLKVALLGPSSLKGEKLLELLDDADLAIEQLALFESEEAAGRSLMFRGHACRTRPYSEFDAGAVRLVLVCEPVLDAETVSQLEQEQNAYVVDMYPERYTNTECCLVHPAVNGTVLESLDAGRVIGVPGSATITAALGLAPLHAAYELLKVNLTVLVAASEAEREGVEALAQETARLLNGREPETGCFGDQLAFNLLPDVGEVLPDRTTRFETQVRTQLTQLLGEDLEIEVSAVRVPVFYGNLVMAQAETRQAVNLDKVQELMDRAPGVRYDHQPTRQPSLVKDAVGQEVAIVHRIRQDAEQAGGFALHLLGDDLGLGGALAALQIAQRLPLA